MIIVEGHGLSIVNMAFNILFLIEKKCYWGYYVITTS